MPEKRYKIIHVITTLGLGGAERLVLDLMRFRDRENFDFEVISMVRGGELERDFQDCGIGIKVLRKKTKLGLGIFMQLHAYFKETKPDVVHTHLFGADLWAGLAAHFARVPVIVKTEHNVNLDQGFFKKIIKRLTAFVFKYFIAVSPSVAEHMVRAERVPEKKINVIYNGVDISRFGAKGGGGFSSSPVLINVSRFEEQKGHKYLIRALKEIEKLPWTMRLVGDGLLRPEIEDMVKVLGLDERVKFLGERRDIPKLLSEADIFVFPSLWEGLGIAVLEAGAVGLPIVATKVAGISDVFSHAKNAILVPPENSKALADGLSWLIERPDEAMSMGRAARELVARDFTAQNTARQYEGLYKLVI